MSSTSCGWAKRVESDAWNVAIDSDPRYHTYVSICTIDIISRALDGARGLSAYGIYAPRIANDFNKDFGWSFNNTNSYTQQSWMISTEVKLRRVFATWILLKLYYALHTSVIIQFRKRSGNVPNMFRRCSIWAMKAATQPRRVPVR